MGRLMPLLSLQRCIGPYLNDIAEYSSNSFSKMISDMIFFIAKNIHSSRITFYIQNNHVNILINLWMRQTVGYSTLSDIRNSFSIDFEQHITS